MGELVRDLGLEGQKQKEGTPTMGGLIIIIATLVPVLLFTKINNIYIILLIISMIWMGAIGFIDDYLKKIKKNKDGLSGKFKVIGQVGLGLVVGAVMFYHSDILVKENTPMRGLLIQIRLKKVYAYREKAGFYCTICEE